MTTKKTQDVNGQVAPKMEIKKTPSTKAATTTKKGEKKQPTVEELQKRVQKLTAQLQAVPQDLDSRIEYFNNKKSLIRKLGSLDANAKSLQIHLDRLAELAAENEFDTENYILSIEGGEHSYRKDDVFKLKNPVLIADVLTYLLGKLEAKADELKKQIAA